MERKFDLKLANGKVATWTGKDGEDAARRYVDCVRPGVAVVASRPSDDTTIHVLGQATIIG